MLPRINVFYFRVNATVSVAAQMSVCSWLQMRRAAMEKARSPSFCSRSLDNKVIVAGREVGSSARNRCCCSTVRCCCFDEIVEVSRCSSVDGKMG